MSGATVLCEGRPFKPFLSHDEYLFAMKEDLSEWLQNMYPELGIDSDNFIQKLWTGVALCKHANAVKEQAIVYIQKKQAKSMTKSSMSSHQTLSQADLLTKFTVKYFEMAKAGTFYSRDNVSNFINWCRNSLNIYECLLFESDDLIMQKNEKHVILCLLEVARRGAKFGMPAPMLVQMERQIDREIAADQKRNNAAARGAGSDESENGKAAGYGEEEDEDESDLDDDENGASEPILQYGPVPQIVTNDLKSLDEMVRDLVAQCTCPTQFPMIRVSEGKYKIGDTKVLIFVRILRNHVMVRVGGGWDTLSHYLDKHDPCRCRSQHRTTQSARLVNKPGAADLHGSHVYYDRCTTSSSSLQQQQQQQPGYSGYSLGPPMNSLNRSRSRSPSTQSYSRRSISPAAAANNLSVNSGRSNKSRSRSPTPYFTSTHQAKISSSSPSGPSSPAKKQITVNTIQLMQQQQVAPVLVKTETHFQINNNNNNDTLTDNSDTTSEVSDEGYRSLGIVNKSVVVPVLSCQLSQDEDVIDHEHLQENNDDDDELNDVGLRKTHFSQIYTTTTTSTKSRASSLERGSLIPSRNSPKSSLNLIEANKNGTWNGRQKQSRKSMSNETFKEPQVFARNGIGRRSVSSLEAGSRRSSSSSSSASPTKSIKDELKSVLKTSRDEAVLIKKVQDLMKQYVGGEDDEEELGMSRRRNVVERKSMRSPRRDSKRNESSNYSRIPAPIH